VAARRGYSTTIVQSYDGRTITKSVDANHRIEHDGEPLRRDGDAIVHSIDWM
jgi:hypothetical protein